MSGSTRALMFGVFFAVDATLGTGLRWWTVVVFCGLVSIYWFVLAALRDVMEESK